VAVSQESISVPAGQTATVEVTLTAEASDVPSSLAGGHFSFYEISGQVRLSADSGDLNVPYLMVPRSLTKGDVTAPVINPPRNATVTATLTNESGAYPAAMDFYTWGLQDAQDVTMDGASGYDLRAAGVQSFPF